MLSRVTARYVRRHVKITFDLLQSRERKRLSGQVARNELVRDSFRRRVSFGGASERAPPMPRTGGQLIRLTERFITTPRLSGCQFRSGDGSNVVVSRRCRCRGSCVFAVAACPLRSRDTGIGHTARNLAWNYSPEIRLRQSYLWKCHWSNEKLF